jgi:hypothetical protein
VSLVVIVPTYGGLDPECDRGLRALEASRIPVWRIGGHAAIDQARSQLATDALAQGFDEIMWIDADIVFDPLDVERLRAHDLPLVAGVYAKKSTRALALHIEPGTTAMTLGDGGGLVAVRYVGTGFMLTRRALYDAMARELPVCNQRFGKPTVPYFLPMVIEDDKGAWYLGEDYAFCERARRLEVPVVVDTRLRLYHVGRHQFGWEEAGADTQRFASYRYTFTP